MTRQASRPATLLPSASRHRFCICSSQTIIYHPRLNSPASASPPSTSPFSPHPSSTAGRFAGPGNRRNDTIGALTNCAGANPTRCTEYKLPFNDQVWPDCTTMGARPCDRAIAGLCETAMNVCLCRQCMVDGKGVAWNLRTASTPRHMIRPDPLPNTAVFTHIPPSIPPTSPTHLPTYPHRRSRASAASRPSVMPPASPPTSSG